MLKEHFREMAGLSILKPWCILLDKGSVERTFEDYSKVIKLDPLPKAYINREILYLD